MAGRNKLTALVLGSGGARGLAHIGVIKAFEENDIPVDMVTGTSIGALVGGLYAAGKDAASMERIVQSFDKIKVARFFMPKFFGSTFMDNSRIVDFIKEITGDIKIEDMKIPFAAVATDLITGEEVVFNRGWLSDAIIASIAIPTIFQPVHIGGRYLIDGGLSNPLPISTALEMNATKIIAVNVAPNPHRITAKLKNRKIKEISSLIKELPGMFTSLLNDYKWLSSGSNDEVKASHPREIQIKPPTLTRVLLQSISISTNNLMLQHLRYARPDVLIEPKIEEYDMLEFYKGQRIIKCGYDEAVSSVSLIKNEIFNTAFER